MEYPEDRFQFTPDLGRRLRQIRIHAGLKQNEVARWLAEMVFKRYEAYKHNIPAKPNWV